MASARSKSLLILLLISFSLDEILGELIEEQREFDYFALALQWPGTYCQKTKHCCSSNGCCRSSLSPTEFTIHGLWPDYNDGTWPSCCSGPTFDVTKVSSLMGTLEKYWPSLSCSSSSLCHGGKGLFWAHEWEKHGTCSFPVIQDEYSYFTTVLDLYFKYNISKILNDAGYTPTNGDTYPVVGISSAIENAVGASPKLVCSNGAVEEIYICFYKDFKPRDCIIGSNSQDNMLGSSSCPRYISIPEFTPFAFKDEKAAIPWLPDSEAF